MMPGKLISGLLFTFSLMCLAGCQGMSSKQQNNVNPAGKLSLAPTSLNFGNVAVGSTDKISANLTASGADVTVTAASTNNGAFSISGPSLPLKISSGQTATFSVAFSPQASGAISGTFSFTSDAQNSIATAALNGTGTQPAAGQLSLTPASLSFGNVAVGSTNKISANLTASGGDVTVTAASTSNDVFSISGPSLPLKISAGQTATFSVAFSPQASGAVGGTLSFTSDAQNSIATAALNGTGTQPLGETPVLFFTDLDSAPTTGGETVSGYSGAYVTVYGNYFGSSPSVTLNGANCVRLVSGPTAWLWYQKLTIQLGSSCSSGSLVLTAGGQSSNSLAFKVASGNIYFVSTSGKDSNSGSSSSPWRTIPHAVQTAGARAGNIIYVENGVSQTADDGQGWDAALTLRQEWCKGTSSQKDALVAYPGATVQIGPSTASSPSFGLRSTDFTAGGGACGGSWTFAGIKFRGVNPTGLAGGDSWRYVASDVSNPQASSASSGAAFETSQATHVRVLGNYFHDLNVGDTDRLQQGVYFSTDSNHAELGWNEIYNVYGRAGLQIHSSPIASGTGYAMYDLLIHDNLMHHIREEGIIVDTVDPSKGPVQVYNNVVYDTGFDGAGTALYRAVSSDFDTSHGVGTGTIDWFNNTVYCQGGAGCWSSSFEVHQGQALIDRVRNNVLYAVSGKPYWTPSVSTNNSVCPSNATPSQCPNFAGSNNLVYHDGAPTYTEILSNNVNKNPLFITLGSNFQLQSGSPAIGAGTNSSPAARYDMNGVLRQTIPSIGAYQR